MECFDEIDLVCITRKGGIRRFNNFIKDGIIYHCFQLDSKWLHLILYNLNPLTSLILLIPSFKVPPLSPNPLIVIKETLIQGEVAILELDLISLKSIHLTDLRSRKLILFGSNSFNFESNYKYLVIRNRVLL